MEVVTVEVVMVITMEVTMEGTEGPHGLVVEEGVLDGPMDGPMDSYP